SSSDLTIASFGLTDGQVFAGRDGIATITAVNNGFTASATVTVTAFAPRYVGHVQLPTARAESVDEYNGFAFVAAGSAGLMVVNVNDPENPSLVVTRDTPGFAKDVKVVDNYAYVADGASGLRIYDVSTPSNPTEVGSIDTPGDARDVSVENNTAYVADDSGGVAIVDVTTASSPQLIATINGLGNVQGVDVDGGALAIVASNSFYMADVSDPANPVTQGSLSISAGRDVDLQGDYAYLAIYTSGFSVVNVNDPNTPVQVSGANPFYPPDVVVGDSHAFYPDILFVSIIAYTNISDPNNAAFQGAIDLSQHGDYDGLGIDIDDKYVYMSAVDASAGASRLYIGQYRRIVDNGGVAPTVSLTEPTTGTVLHEDRPVTIKANATDDFEVASVSFEVNGEVVFIDRNAPYEFTYRIPQNITGITFGAFALDTAGNEGRATDIAYTVEKLFVADEDWTNQNITASEDVIYQSVLMRQGTFTSSNKLTTIGDFYVSGTAASTINAKQLIVEGNLTVDGVTLVLNTPDALRVLGDMSVINGGRVTVPNPSTSVYHPLNVEVTGTLTVDGTSVIDVNGKGYPSKDSNEGWGGPEFGLENGRVGCHGGNHARNTGDCTYGRYERARFAGSGGWYENSTNRGYGGGFVEINANALVLQGVVRANGGETRYRQYGSAGGGIHVEVESLSGGGSFQARGGDNYGSTSSTNPLRGGGGGRISVYVTDRSGYTGSYQAYGGRNTNQNNEFGGAGTVYIKESGQAYGHLLADNAGRTASTNSTRLRYVGRRTITNAEPLSPGVWRITIDSSPWKASDANLDWGLTGIEVDLDASETNSAHYTIESNTANTLTINTNDDLAGVIGNQLAGVHRFETIRVLGGAYVTAWGDRVLVNDPVNSTVGANSTLYVGETDQSMIQLAGTGSGRLLLSSTPALDNLDLSDLGSSILQFSAPVVVNNDLSIGSGTVRFLGGLQVTGNMVSNGTRIESYNGNTLQVTGNMDLMNGSVLTVPNPSTSVYHPLNVEVTGTLTVDGTSVIDVNGKGYPSK
ncbi:MAG: Ig-like domain-containing protein, partial [Saprospiraceae bacterium]|nr:Ig-like domain-containing protein [Saprospiraceae bacterium]